MSNWTLVCTVGKKSLIFNFCSDRMTYVPKIDGVAVSGEVVLFSSNEILSCFEYCHCKSLDPVFPILVSSFKSFGRIYRFNLGQMGSIFACKDFTIARA